MNATPQIDLHDKSILITGATSGIGLEAAVALARDGAHVVITGRSQARIDAALATIRQHAGVDAEALCADFASLAAVRKLAA